MTNDFDTLISTIEKMSSQHLRDVRITIDKILTERAIAAAEKITAAIVAAQDEGFEVCLKTNRDEEYVIKNDDDIDTIVKMRF